MTTLLLVRHGQTVLNHEQRYQGHMDTELSPTGREQAERLASHLSGVKLDAIYSSDLRRCLDTANPLARGHDLAVEREPALREASYGEWEGATFADIRERFPHLVAERERDPFAFCPPGGESLGTARNRVVAALADIAARHPHGKVLVVTHRGPVRMVVGSLLDIPYSQALTLCVDNCAVSMVESFPRFPIVAHLNVRCHLQGLGRNSLL